MILNLILAFAFFNLTIGENQRRRRSTVLTDESKRILEQFDFSNFDKQEALNYLDRQRYDNQIRGKRSKSKLRRQAIRPCMVEEKGNCFKKFSSISTINEDYRVQTMRKHFFY